MRRPCFVLSVCVGLAVVASGYVYAADTMAWKKFLATPGQSQLPDVSYAGYMYGEKPLPTGDVTVNARDHGAKADGKTDDTEAIRAALHAAGAQGGGVVLLPKGNYRLSGILYMQHSGVVLRGEGAAKTILYWDKPLSEVTAARPNAQGKSAWSWSGGFIWFKPRETPNEETWRERPAVATLAADAKRGDRTVTVDSADPLKPGDWLILSMTDPSDHSLFQHMAGDIPGAAQYDWNDKASDLIRQLANWRWPVEVAAVEGNRVTFRQPLRLDARAAWSPKLHPIGQHVHDAGVEQLTVQMKPDSPVMPHLQDAGYNGICFETAVNCWARDVVLKDCENALGTECCKCITVSGVKVTGRQTHLLFWCRKLSHDCLFTDFRLEAPSFHGINMEGLSSGNVWSNGTIAHGTFDSHRWMPFQNVRTNLVIFNDGVHGGDPKTAGPLFGARCAHWNIRVTNGNGEMIFAPYQMPLGSLVGIVGCGPAETTEIDFAGEMHALIESPGRPVTPANLHEAQLAARLKLPAKSGKPSKAAKPKR
jgi:hypothetical protein